jgi:hypothetical protein
MEETDAYKLLEEKLHQFSIDNRSLLAIDYERIPKYYNELPHKYIVCMKTLAAHMDHQSVIYDEQRKFIMIQTPKTGTVTMTQSFPYRSIIEPHSNIPLFRHEGVKMLSKLLTINTWKSLNSFVVFRDPFQWVRSIFMFTILDSDVIVKRNEFKKLTLLEKDELFLSYLSKIISNYDFQLIFLALATNQHDFICDETGSINVKYIFRFEYGTSNIVQFLHSFLGLNHYTKNLHLNQNPLQKGDKNVSFTSLEDLPLEYQEKFKQRFSKDYAIWNSLPPTLDDFIHFHFPQLF